MTSKFYNSSEFKKLQKQWYAKLKDSGFVDAETVGLPAAPDGMLTQRSSNAYKQADLSVIAIKAEYFSMVAECVEKEQWDDATYEFILRNHADGKSHLAIVRLFAKEKGDTIHRQTVRYVIRRYLNKWGIKYYSPDQLYSKKMPKKTEELHT